MEKIKECLICGSNNLSRELECIDHTLTKEPFTLEKCSDCGFLFTNPRPEKDIIGKYYESPDYISHTNSNRGLVNGIYQFVKKYNLIKKLQLISNYKKSGNILDIGCGTGDFLNICKKSKWITFGIEPNDKARSFAQKNNGIDVFTEDKLNEFENNFFDVITLWHVLEHVSDLNERIITIKRILKKDGILVVAVPNCDSKDAKIYKQYWAGYDVPRHLYHFTPNTIEKLFNKHNMNVIRVMPMVFDSYYVSILSEKYRSGKQKLFKAFINGFISNLSAIKSGKTYSSQIFIIKNK
ncbi:MAG: class I SAM-dependent methyltransferase [Bacteroidota bacterium]|nr:class I SAM-dependent methyltransferase [Bacteroidota bacterium]